MISCGVHPGPGAFGPAGDAPRHLGGRYETARSVPRAAAGDLYPVLRQDQSKNPNSAPGYEPFVVFDKSGKFVFTENFYAGLGDFAGTYTIEDDRIYCTVNSVAGLALDSVKEIVFKIVDENTLKLKTELTMSYNSELFYRK